MRRQVDFETFRQREARRIIITEIPYQVKQGGDGEKNSADLVREREIERDRDLARRGQIATVLSRWSFDCVRDCAASRRSLRQSALRYTRCQFEVRRPYRCNSTAARTGWVMKPNGPECGISSGSRGGP